MHAPRSLASAGGGGRARRRRQVGPGQARGHERGQLPAAERAPADGQRRNRDLGLGGLGACPVAADRAWEQRVPMSSRTREACTRLCVLPRARRVHTLYRANSGGGGLLQYFVSGTILMNFGASVNLTGIIIYKWANYPVVIFYKGVNPVYLLCFKTCTHLSSEKSHFGNNTISPCSFVSFLLFITRLEILRQMSEMEN